MPQSLPDAATLLKAAIRYLDEELSPELAGYHRFKTRVTINVLSTIKRELELGASQAADEEARLTNLLGHPGILADQNEELTAKIMDGRMGSGDPVLRAHLRATLREALMINNPKWIRE